MALYITHNFYSNVAATANDSLVGSFEWNDYHVMEGNLEWANVANVPVVITASANGLPQTYVSSAYTLVATDAGNHIRMKGSHTVTVPHNVFANGETIVVFNADKAAMTIANNSSSLLILPSANTTGNVTLGGYGLATIMCVDDVNDDFTVTGAGIE